MEREFGSKPLDLHAAVGPCIRACCYEVGPEVEDAWRSYVPQAEELLLPASSGRVHLDLPGAIVLQLQSAGLARERIQDTGLCTACRTDKFYSYRAEGPGTGRLMTVAVLLPTVS